jgi:hypothetical protein
LCPVEAVQWLWVWVCMVPLLRCSWRAVNDVVCHVATAAARVVTRPLINDQSSCRVPLPSLKSQQQSVT